MRAAALLWARADARRRRTSLVLIVLLEQADGHQPGHVEAAPDRLTAEGFEVVVPRPGAEVLRFESVSQLPGALALLLAVVAGVWVAHSLAATPDRRRRTLATVVALGLSRRQLVGVLVAQAMTTAVAGAFGGLLLGWLVGQAAWSRAADAVGVPADIGGMPPVVPVIVLGVVALSALLALPVGTRAGRHPAASLRSDA